MRRSASVACLFAFTLLLSPARAASPYDDMLKNVAPNTNTLVLIDVKGAFNSTVAKAEQWVEKRRQNSGGGLGFIPWDAEAVVIAAEVNFNALTRDFQVGMVKVSSGLPSMQELAAREAGTIDEIAGRFAVLSPRDVYFTNLPGSQLVALYPADRQYTARYLKAVQAKKTGELTPYLRKAADAAGSDTLTIALDLEDVVDRTLLRLSLPASPSVAKAKTVDIPRLAQFLAGIKGMTFSARVTDGITGRVTVQFTNDPSLFRRALPDLFRELLEGQGIAIPGFDNWETKFTDTTMTMSGPLSTADVKRIISLFAFPNPAGEPDQSVKGNEPSAPMTRRYLTAVDAVMTDIRGLRKTTNYNKTATWHDKAAAQIEQLSRQRVDPIASDAAIQVARRLRAIGDSLRGVPIDAKALQSQQYYYSRPQVGMVPGGFWGWRPFVFGPNQVDTNIPQIQAQVAKVVADDEKRRIEAWSDIDRILQAARARLAEKYKTDF